MTTTKLKIAFTDNIFLRLKNKEGRAVTKYSCKTVPYLYLFCTSNSKTFYYVRKHLKKNVQKPLGKYPQISIEKAEELVRLENLKYGKYEVIVDTKRLTLEGTCSLSI